MPTTTPHYTWLYTFTELTPVQCLAELRGLQSLLFILTQANAYSGGRVEPREALLRGRSLAPLHSLQGSKPFFNIGDKERGRDGRDQTREEEVMNYLYLFIFILELFFLFSFL